MRTWHCGCRASHAGQMFRDHIERWQKKASAVSSCKNYMSTSDTYKFAQLAAHHLSLCLLPRMRLDRMERNVLCSKRINLRIRAKNDAGFYQGFAALILLAAKRMCYIPGIRCDTRACARQWSRAVVSDVATRTLVYIGIA